eukprot:s5120_g10.t1
MPYSRIAALLWLQEAMDKHAVRPKLSLRPKLQLEGQRAGVPKMRKGIFRHWPTAPAVRWHVLCSKHAWPVYISSFSMSKHKRWVCRLGCDQLRIASVLY